MNPYEFHGKNKLGNKLYGIRMNRLFKLPPEFLPTHSEVIPILFPSSWMTPDACEMNRFEPTISPS